MSYKSSQWGHIKFQVDDENKVKAIYSMNEGTFSGQLNPDTGLVQGVWCQAPDRGKNRGLAEFQISKDENTPINGKWKNAGAQDWQALNLTETEEPLKSGVDFNNNSSFCD